MSRSAVLFGIKNHIALGETLLNLTQTERRGEKIVARLVDAIHDRNFVSLAHH